jgi:dCMP deaminase
MSDVVVAYVPVLHEGYRRFLSEHGRGRPLYLIGPELYVDFRPLAKDVRALDAQLAARAIAAWEIASGVEVLTVERAEALAAQAPRIVLPDEDVSHQVVERFFARCEVRYDSVFLRWDRTRTVRMLRPGAPPATDDLAWAAEQAATRSVDWWRQVGAALRLPGGEVLSAANEHLPHRLSAYAAGDPRSNFNKGVNHDLTTAMHAEARVIADAARRGLAVEGGELYVTDFPCPACAKLVAAAGIVKLWFREGYAVLDGEDVLAAAGVEVVRAA